MYVMVMLLGGKGNSVSNETINNKLDRSQKLQDKKDYSKSKERAELKDEDLDSLPHNVYVKLNKA